ncbi:hypothetical protein [Acetobacterium woodii]|uniref:Uncharacterized protein n=1 Tax=Acetobacterium woodii (strain ATCC 29683 / DSM 1030 / JCM 2381 / KCTC 1655 / WB1) TaxID=931626 RepID=H6LIX3_ACEWD|nr:hypothetical protein [Acetobacterium woodii]AFA49862.1 hypothetical protein Awo_c31340 [Acetobacterium woodii DSM 1030]
MDLILANIQSIGAKLPLIVGWLVTIYIAKYSATKPMKVEIKKAQYHKVYSPIYIYLRDLKQNEPERVISRKEVAYIYSIFRANFSLVELNNILLCEKILIKIKLGENYEDDFIKLYQKINIKYLLLRKSIGYPSINILSSFNEAPRNLKIMIVLSILAFIVSSILALEYLFSLIDTIFSSFEFNNILYFIIYASGFILLIVFLIEKIRSNK